MRDTGSMLCDSLSFPLLLKHATIMETLSNNPSQFMEKKLTQKNKRASQNVKSVNGRALLCQALDQEKYQLLSVFHHLFLAVASLGLRILADPSSNFQTWPQRDHYTPETQPSFGEERYPLPEGTQAESAVCYLMSCFQEMRTRKSQIIGYFQGKVNLKSLGVCGKKI